MIKSLDFPVSEVGKTEVKSIGRWSEVRQTGEYSLAYAVPDGKAADFVKAVGVSSKAKKIITEMNVFPERGKNFDASYKLRETSNVSCQSVNLNAPKDVVWKSDEGERPEGQTHHCKEWDASQTEPAKYYIHVLATPINDPQGGSDPETRIVEVTK